MGAPALCDALKTNKTLTDLSFDGLIVLPSVVYVSYTSLQM